MPSKTHEEYFANCTDEARSLLLQIQAEVERQVPGAMRCIGYGMPAFKQRKIFFYFAAFKKHVGIYPPVNDDPVLIKETAQFRGPKGNLSFPYGQHFPLELVGRVAKALAVQYSAQTVKPATARRA